MPGYVDTTPPDNAYDVTNPWMNAFRKKMAQSSSDPVTPPAPVQGMTDLSDVPLPPSSADPTQDLLGNPVPPSASTYRAPDASAVSDAAFKNMQLAQDRDYKTAHPNATILDNPNSYSFAGGPNEEMSYGPAALRIREAAMTAAKAIQPHMMTGSFNGQDFAMAPSMHMDTTHADRLLQLYNADRSDARQQAQLGYEHGRETAADAQLRKHQDAGDAILAQEAGAHVASANADVAGKTYNLKRQQEVDQLGRPVQEAQAQKAVTDVGQQYGPAQQRQADQITQLLQSTNPATRAMARRMQLEMTLKQGGHITSPSEDQAIQTAGETSYAEAAAAPQIQQHYQGVDQLLARGHWNLGRDTPAILGEIQQAMAKTRAMGGGDEAVQGVKKDLLQKVLRHTGDYSMLGYTGGDTLARQIQELQ